LVALTINGQEVKAKSGVTILEAAQWAGIYIPALCYHPALKPVAQWRAELACGLCMVEVESHEDLPLSCVTRVAEGMVVYTETPQVQEARRENLRAILVEHPHACLTCDRVEHCGPSDICIRNVPTSERCVSCPKHGRCELQSIVKYIGLGESPLPYRHKGLPKTKGEPLFDRDNNLCVLCGRCISVCRDVVGAEALAFIPHDGEITVGPSSGESYRDAGCKFCGACVEVCPTAALMDRRDGLLSPIERRRLCLVDLHVRLESMFPATSISSLRGDLARRRP